MPEPKINADKVIIKTFESIQNNELDNENETFFDRMLQIALGKEKDAYVSIDYFTEKANISYTEEYEIEWEGDFDFEKLYFIYGDTDGIGFIKDNEIFKDARLLGALVYDGNLFLGKVDLNFKDRSIKNPTELRLLFSTYNNITGKE